MPLGKLGVVLERSREPVGFTAHLALEIGNLRAQLLDARMLVQQRRRLLGELGAQRDALLGEAPHQLGIDDVGEFDRCAGAQRRRG